MKHAPSLSIKVLKNVVIIAWFIIVIVITKVKQQFFIGASKTHAASNITKSSILDAARILDTNLNFDRLFGIGQSMHLL